MFCFFGLSEDIVSVWGPQFISRVWKALCEFLNINISHTSVYHPQSNGQVKQLNQETGQFLQTYCSQNQLDWSHFFQCFPNLSWRTPITAHFGFSLAYWTHPRSSIAVYRLLISWWVESSVLVEVDIQNVEWWESCRTGLRHTVLDYIQLFVMLNNFLKWCQDRHIEL